LTSADGVNWVQRLSSGIGSLDGIAYGNGQFVAVGGTILSSADGVNWVQHESAYGTAIAYGNGHFVAVGPGGTILQSSSIITLALARKIGTGLLTLSLEGSSGLGYTLQTSTNLISWRNLTNITGAQPTNVIFETLPTGSDKVFYRAYFQQ